MVFLAAGERRRQHPRNPSRCQRATVAGWTSTSAFLHRGHNRRKHSQSRRFEGILEGFNLFNYENYGSYVTQESNRNYGQPSFNSNIAYQPRMLQLGFRFAF
jgi:hypothetical protein